jgi:hypothetical protein
LSCALQVVRADPSVQGVAPGPSEDRVVPPATMDRVGAAAPTDHVITRRAVQGVACAVPLIVQCPAAAVTGVDVKMPVAGAIPNATNRDQDASHGASFGSVDHGTVAQATRPVKAPAPPPTEQHLRAIRGMCEDEIRPTP